MLSSALSQLQELRQRFPGATHLDPKTTPPSKQSQAIIEAEQALRAELNAVPISKQTDAAKDWLETDKKCTALRRCLTLGHQALGKLQEAKRSIRFPWLLNTIRAFESFMPLHFAVDWLLADSGEKMAQGQALLRHSFPDLAEKGGAVRNALAADESYWDPANYYALCPEWNVQQSITYATQHLDDLLEALTDRLPRFQAGLEKQLLAAATAEQQLAAP
jgi:hypothetical protein